MERNWKCVLKAILWNIIVSFVEFLSKFLLIYLNLFSNESIFFLTSLFVCPVNSENPVTNSQFCQLLLTFGTKIAEEKEVNILKWIEMLTLEKMFCKKGVICEAGEGVWSRDQEKCNNRVATCKVIKNNTILWSWQNF